MATIRVLVVDDSLTVRKHLVDLLGADTGMEVVGEATNGQEALSMCLALRPDVVTLDLVMPVMSGLEATEAIMAHCPTPILILSASFNRGELFKSYEALAAGAVELMEKPRSGDQAGARAWEATFLDTVRLISRIKVLTHPRGLRRASLRSAVLASPADPPRLVVLGASTGGPSALREILMGLPASFPLPILVVLHIGMPFGLEIPRWLAQQVPFPVRPVVDGEALPAAGRIEVLFAPPEHHVELRGGRLVWGQGAERHSCRPSVDVLFESVASELGSRSIAGLLTGIGRDGAAGMLAIRRAGGRTLAQDEASSAVFGMPRAAIALDAAERILALSAIAPALIALAAGGPFRKDLP